jgi:hypothetical protein
MPAEHVISPSSLNVVSGAASGKGDIHGLRLPSLGGCGDDAILFAAKTPYFHLSNLSQR